MRKRGSRAPGGGLWCQVFRKTVDGRVRFSPNGSDRGEGDTLAVPEMVRITAGVKPGGRRRAAPGRRRPPAGAEVLHP